MDFRIKQQKMYDEFNKFYAHYPSDVSKVTSELYRLDKDNNFKSPFAVKGMMYKTLAKYAKVKVFKNCPFYFEIDSGIARGELGGKLPIKHSGFGSWIQERNRELNDPFVAWYKPYEDKGFIHMLSKFFDTNHIVPGYENVFKYGLNGLKNLALEKLEKETDEEKIAFYQAMIDGLDAGIELSKKFVLAAQEELDNTCDEDEIKNLKRIIDSAAYCPANPPRTFYEAINTYYFFHELLKIFDCMSICTIGHPDRELITYYNNDINNGILSREEAKELIEYYLCITDGIFDYYAKDKDHINANTAVTVGGLNADGSLVYNEITSIILEAMSELQLVNPNMSVRVSSKDSDKYIKEIAQMVASGCNNYSIIYDDVAINSLLKAGFDIEDARIYGTGGCQEIIVPNMAHFARAFLYINLPMLLNMSISGDSKDKEFLSPYFDLKQLSSANSYGEIHDLFMSNFRRFCIASANRYKAKVSDAVKYNPLPLYSASMDGCIDSGLDYTQGGTKYYNNSIGLVGVGTIVDMLYTIKTEVFEKHTYTLEQLVTMAKVDFVGYERDRQYLINKVKKYGDDDQEVNKFAGLIIKELAEYSTGMDDGLGKYVASMFSYNWYAKMGFKTEATLDGRKKGSALSRSVGPSELGRSIEISKCLHSMEYVDNSDYPGITVLYLDMPYTQNKLDISMYEDVIKYFMANKGFVLQLNVVDRDKLIAAKKDPDKYRNLVVRVCGFSEYFVSIEAKRQDEMINRNRADSF